MKKTQITLRLKQDLKEELEKIADNKNRSLNNLIESILEEFIGYRQDVFQHIRHTMKLAEMHKDKGDGK